MFAKTARIGVMAALCTTLGTYAVPAEQAEAPGSAISVDAQLLKDAENTAFSAEQLRPIALENLPAPIDLTTLGAADAPGANVSAAARALRDLDPSEIPGAARQLGGIARGGVPGAGGSAGAHSPSLPPAAAQNRRSGRGGR